MSHTKSASTHRTRSLILTLVMVSLVQVSVMQAATTGYALQASIFDSIHDLIFGSSSSSSSVKSVKSVTTHNAASSSSIAPIAESSSATSFAPSFTVPIQKWFTVAGYRFPRTIRTGMLGDDVLNLQLILNRHPQTQMAKTGTESPGQETGTFDYKTRIGLIAFQKANLITAEQLTRLRREQGFAGLTTRVALEKIAKDLVAQGKLPSDDKNLHAAAQSAASSLRLIQSSSSSRSATSTASVNSASSVVVTQGSSVVSEASTASTASSIASTVTSQTSSVTSVASSAASVASSVVASSQASSVTSVQNGKILTPGSGFSGPTPEPAPIGTGNGADAKAIARWDTVPYQTFDTNINVGVVAFHMNEIDHVSFSVNGGPWKDIASMTLNPETNIVEYWATVRAGDFPDGQIEVRAIAYPTVGIPRVLQGTKVQANGEFSLFLSSNSTHTLSQTAVYVSPAGSDTTGNGTSGNPYATIAKALLSVNPGGVLDGVTVYLAEGDYTAPSGQRLATKQWMTVTSAPGANPDRVRIVLQGRPKAPLIHFKHLTFVPYTSTLLEGYGDGIARCTWLDDVTVQGPSRYQTQRSISNQYLIFATDSRWQDTVNGATDVLYARNIQIRRIASDSFQNSKMIVNSTIDDADRGVTGAHPDFYQIYSPGAPVDNHIFYGVTGTNMNSQGIFIGAVPDGDKVHNMALVNVSIEYNHVTPNFFSQWFGAADHVLLKGMTIKQVWHWGQVDLHNFIISDSTFDGMNADAANTQKIISTATFIRTHIKTAGSFDSINTP